MSVESNILKNQALHFYVFLLYFIVIHFYCIKIKELVLYGLKIKIKQKKSGP